MAAIISSLTMALTLALPSGVARSGLTPFGASDIVCIAPSRFPVTNGIKFANWKSSI